MVDDLHLTMRIIVTGIMTIATELLTVNLVKHEGLKSNLNRQPLDLDLDLAAQVKVLTVELHVLGLLGWIGLAAPPQRMALSLSGSYRSGKGFWNLLLNNVISFSIPARILVGANKHTDSSSPW